VAQRETCKATRDDGEPCRSPFVGEDGYCDAHRPGGREVVRERARRGGYARGQQGPPGLEAEELPALEDHRDAKLWLERIGRAVCTGRLGDSQANAAIRAVSEWVRAHEGELTAYVVEDLADEVRRLKEELDGSAGNRATLALRD
jgi:hypothetical protein